MSTLLTEKQLNTDFNTKNDYITEINKLVSTEDTYSTNLLAIFSDVDANNTTILDYINKLNIDITNAKETNKKLKNDLGETNTDINGSTELINNYKYLYNSNYLTNFSMVIGIGFAGLFLVKGFSN
jgi:hypothetical protein